MIVRKLKKIIKNGIEYILSFVDLDTNQIVDWVKTFLKSPIVPTPTNNTDAATKKYVDDKYADLMAMWKFLSLWNSATWQPISFPLDTPYTYHTGDYFMVEILATGGDDNLMPNGSSYTWTASQTPDTTNEVKKWDFYIYDWIVWLYASNHGKTVSFANLAWQPTDNANLSMELGNKQDKLVSWTNIKTINWTSILWSWNINTFSASTITVTLASANWSNNEITVTATGVTASNTVIVSPDPTYMSDYTSNWVYCSAQGSGTLTFTCDTEPSNDIDVNVVILG